jgi:hypothetical protein
MSFTGYRKKPMGGKCLFSYVKKLIFSVSGFREKHHIAYVFSTWRESVRSTNAHKKTVPCTGQDTVG